MRGNIIKAVYNDTGRYKTVPLYQYDYGQILQIEGAELPTAYEVHFSNTLHGAATTQIGDADGVSIPDMYLLKDQAIYAWLYLHTGEDDGETEFMITIPVNHRSKAEDVPPTPVQQSVIEEAIAVLNQAVEDVGEHFPDGKLIAGTGNATGIRSVAVSQGTKATGQCAFAEGIETEANGVAAHSEGTYTKANGNQCVAEGENTIAGVAGQSKNAHAMGVYTRALSSNQFAYGKYNIADSEGTYVEIVGNGTGTSARSNARTLDWSGNEELAGSLTLGKGTEDEVTITAAQLKALLAML